MCAHKYNSKISLACKEGNTNTVLMLENNTKDLKLSRKTSRISQNFFHEENNFVSTCVSVYGENESKSTSGVHVPAYLRSKTQAATMV